MSKVDLAIKTFLTKYKGKQQLKLPISTNEKKLYNNLKRHKPDLDWEVDEYIQKRLAIRDNYLLNLIKSKVNDFDIMINIGAGFSTLGINIKNKKSIEIDFPEVLNEKRNLYSKLGLDHNNKTTFVGANIEEINWNSLPIKGRKLYLLEGISYYLPQKTINQIFTTIAKEGSELILDYFIKDMKLISSKFPEANRLAKKLEEKGCPILWTINPDKIEDYLSILNLKLEFNDSILDIMNRYGEKHNPWVYLLGAKGMVIK